MNVLIIEPARYSREILNQLVLDAGASANAAEDGSHALEVISQQMPDAILAAHEMGDMDSSEFMNKLKRSHGSRIPPILLITAQQDEDIRKRAFKLGYTEVLDRSQLAEVSRGIQSLVAQSSLKLNAKVLLVEDSESAAKVTTAYLEDMGTEVDWATNAESALEMIEANDYELVVSDIVLPGKLSGLGLVDRLRNREDYKAHLPVLAISSWTDSARRNQILGLGANDFVFKPIQPEEFRVRVGNLVNNQRNIEKLARQQELLFQMATTDKMTGLFNRRVLEEFTFKYISNARRTKSPLCLLIVDIDDFTGVNASHGHSVGDRVLKDMGKLLNASCRNEDIAARFSGGEFVLLLSNCNQDSGQRMADRLLQSIASEKPGGMELTINLGLAELPTEGECDFEQFFKLAEAALRAD